MYRPDAGDGVSRRRFLSMAGATAGFVALSRLDALSGTRAGRGIRTPGSALAQDGGATQVALQAGTVELDLAGRAVTTWGYNGTVPGPVVRLRAGGRVQATVTNALPEPTTVHWHGIALANPMDGVPDVTQPAIEPDATFEYDFVAPDAGTYFFHPHHGLQLDRGLYAPLIIDDPSDPGGYDAEWVLVLDDWTDGVGRSPEAILARLQRGMGMGSGDGEMGGHSGMNHGAIGGGMDMGSGDGSSMDMEEMMSSALGSHGGDVSYPLFLINGRAPKDPETFRAEPGQRVRLRVINAGSDTAFRVAIGGHRLTVTHSDGFAVEPVETDAVLLGMGERVDALVTVAEGAVPVVAHAEGKGGDARAVLRGGPTGEAPARRAKVDELDGELVTSARLRPAADVALSSAPPDRRHRLVLDGNHHSYRWTINGRVFDPDDEGLPVSDGQRVRLAFTNNSTMWHPMHLHGHTFAVVRQRVPGVRKDTVIVRPGERVSVDFDADNPGKWMVHCHNAYHQEAGMMASVAYR